MKIVGLTGGIGSGKSTVAQLFNELGVPVYNSDVQAKHLMTTEAPLKKAIVHLLGKEAYHHGSLNRAFIAAKVFKDATRLHALNAIVHPAVRVHFLQWVQQQSAPYVIQETALLFENDAQAQYDAVVVVTAPLALRLQRVMARDGLSEQQVRDRIRHQSAVDEKAALADFCISNIDLNTTRAHVAALHQKLLALAS